MVGLPIVNGNIFGRPVDGLQDQIGRYLYDTVIFNLAAGSGQQLERPVMQDLHADVRQYIQRGLMDFVLIVI